MKLTRLLLPLTLLLAGPASAQITFNVPGMTAEQQKALSQMIGPLAQASQAIQTCIEGELGSTGMRRMEDMGKAMNKEILPLCKAGKKEEARGVALRYAETDEGKAAFKCGKEHKDLLQNPNSARLLGRYSPMAGALAEGRVPDDVCQGLNTKKKTTPAAPRLQMTPSQGYSK